MSRQKLTAAAFVRGLELKGAEYLFGHAGSACHTDELRHALVPRSSLERRAQASTALAS